MKERNSLRMILALAVLLAALAAPVIAQLQTGNLYGTVVSPEGELMPGATVTLTGSGAPMVQTTNERGEFRFLGLPPGTYKVEAQLDQFSPVSFDDLVINVGRNTQIEMSLLPMIGGVIDIIAEAPLLDARRPSLTSTVDKDQLERIPTARDPWAILQSTPGVLTDRINVGGNESGQQSQYVGPGSAGTQAVWSLDGVVMTHMSATGS